MCVPERLADKLVDAGNRFADDLLGAYLRMAYCIIHFYLGERWFIEKIRLQHESDPFMLNELDEESENRFTYQDRVISLADALFQLRNCQNFDVLCERFNSRTTKPCFTEAKTATSFVKDGFQIEIVQESGVRGADFDFIAHGPSQDISIEVTAKDPTPLTVATIRNTLTRKRSQILSDRAAILYIIIPEDCTEDARTAEAIFSEALENFFRRSRRFNAGVLVWEATLVLDEGRIVALTYHPFENPSPRHPIDDMSFLRPDHPRGDLNTLRNRISTDSEGLREELGGFTSEPHTSFYDWYLLSGQ